MRGSDGRGPPACRTGRHLWWFFRDVLGLADHEADAMRLAGSVGPDTAALLAFLVPSADAPTAAVSTT